MRCCKRTYCVVADTGTNVWWLCHVRQLDGWELIGNDRQKFLQAALRYFFSGRQEINVEISPRSVEIGIAALHAAAFFQGNTDVWTMQ